MKILPRRRHGTASSTDVERATIARLVRRPLFELIPLRNALERAEALPAGAVTTVTASPSHGIEATVDLGEGLIARGHETTPHLAAHMFRDRAHVAELLDRCRSSGIRSAFVVGGDAKDRGEIHDGLALIRLMEDLGHPFTTIGIPGYPEGHPVIPSDELMASLRAKQAHAAYMTTQMCFDPDAIATWITRMRSEGITLPVHLGLPGAATLGKLTTVGARIGVAGSVRFLRKHRSLLGHVMKRSFGPDALLETLAPVLADPVADIRALHLFTFNQVEETVAWQRRMLAELEG
jgi:methylenetetrahydrofolate reductase (NADPH)